MKKPFPRLLSLVLALAVTLSLVLPGASAAQTPSLAMPTLIAEESLFLPIGSSLTLALSEETLPENAVFASDSAAVFCDGSSVLTGAECGRSEVTVTADEVLLDTVTVYCFQPSEFSVASTGRKDAPRTVTITNPAIPGGSRTYPIYKQQYDPTNHPWLRYHGCGACCVASIAQGYGTDHVTAPWLEDEGVQLIAKESGCPLPEGSLPYGSENGGKTLGYYGMQQILAYNGISSKIYSNWTDQRDAVEEMVRALSQGHPIILMTNTNTWNDIKFASAYHYIYLAGLDSNGHVINVCSSSANVQYLRTKKETHFTITEILDHFTNSAKRTQEDDFLLSSTKKSGWQVFVEVTGDNADQTAPGRNHLAGALAEPEPLPEPEPQPIPIDINAVTLDQTDFVYDGTEHTPAVSVEGLTEGTDYTVSVEGGLHAGTGTVTVTGIGAYTGTIALPFTVSKADNPVTLSGKSLKASTAQDQTFPLPVETPYPADLSWTSSSSQVTIGEDGMVTVPQDFSGLFTVTASAAETMDTNAASETVTVTVTPAKVSISSLNSPKQKKVVVKWNRPKNIGGCQVQYALNKSFTSAKTAVSTGTSKTLIDLKNKKTYYFRVRTYKKSNGKTLYSGWSSVKSIKIK